MLSFRQGMTCLMLMIDGFSPILRDYGGLLSDYGGRLADKHVFQLELRQVMDYSPRRSVPRT